MPKTKNKKTKELQQQIDIKKIYKLLVKELQKIVPTDTKLEYLTLVQQTKLQKQQRHMSPIACTVHTNVKGEEPKKIASEMISLLQFQVQNEQGAIVMSGIKQLAAQGELKQFIFGCRDLCTVDVVGIQVFYQRNVLAKPPQEPEQQNQEGQ